MQIFNGILGKKVVSSSSTSNNQSYIQRKSLRLTRIGISLNSSKSASNLYCFSFLSSNYNYIGEPQI
jgi:hypothetical protein